MAATMRGLLRLLLMLVVGLGLALPAAAQDFPDRGTAPVLDNANVIDPATKAALTQKLDDFEKRTQRQFVIVTLPSLQGYDIADYGYQLGRKWGLGDKERNDGVILIVVPNDKKVRIEVGYGLEGTLPDGLAYNYIQGMTPYFKNGDYSGGISWGADQIMQQLELPPEEAAKVAQETQAQQANSGSGDPFGLIMPALFILFFFVLPMMRRGGRRRYRSGLGGTVGDIMLWEAGKAIARGMSDHDDWGGGGGFGGGGFGGGGGFSGGGGSFGGGGASGGW